MIPKISLISVLCGVTCLQATLVKQFPFPLGAHALYKPFGRFYVAASQAVPKNDFAIAYADRTDREFRALAPEKVVLNNKAEQSNPLFGAAIDHLVMLDRRPVVVSHQAPSSLFLIDDRRNPLAVFQSPNLHDAQGRSAPKILSLTTIATDQLETLSMGSDLAVLAAVPNRRGSFDGDGSGIALAYYRQVKQGKDTFYAWDVVNAVTGVSSFPEDGSVAQGNRALPFQKDTEALMINQPVSAISSVVDLHFDRELGRLYLATQVTSAAANNAGARGIIVASIFNGRVQYHAIAPDGAFTEAGQIVGAKGARSRTSIYKVRTLQTKTYLRYLIVVGGQGESPELDQQVFALPLVENLEDPERHGTLANIQVPPVDIFGEHHPYRFMTRVYAVPAQRPEEVFSMSSTPARVGGSGILPGPITDIQIAGEAVFVSCTERHATNLDKAAPGIFYSQPVCDALGRVSGWTDWKRAYSAQPTAGCAYDSLAGIFWQLPQGDGTSSEVYRSQWTDGTDELSSFIMQHFNKEKGGIQGLFDMPYTTQGFTTAVDERLSVQVMTGFKKVLITQTGKQQQGLFAPYAQYHDTYMSSDGSLSGFTGASNLVCSGGALELVGPITSAAVVSDGKAGWFVVAGVGGIAILANEQGIGWDATKGLASQFAGLSSAASWRLISTTPFVRNLVVQDGKLFALSHSKLERFDITQDELRAGTLTSVILAELTQEQKDSAASFSDVYIKGPLALLATSFGLLRSSNFADVRAQAMVTWVSVPLAESVGSLTHQGPVTRFFAIKPSSQDMADNVYLLNAYVGLDQSMIYRLVVHLDHAQVTDESVKLFPDYVLKGTNSFFANLGEYRNYVVTDGSFIAISRSSHRQSQPIVQLLSPALKGGESARVRVPFLLLPTDAQTVGGLVRSSATGSWMVPGDFGIRMQQ